MVGQVELGVVHPIRGAEIERMNAQPLAESRAGADPLSEGRRERLVSGCRTFENRKTTDRQAHMLVGVFDLEESGIEGCQLIHGPTSPCI